MSLARRGVFFCDIYVRMGEKVETICVFIVGFSKAYGTAMKKERVVYL